MMKLGAFHLVNCVVATLLAAADAPVDITPVGVFNLISNGSTAALLAAFLFYYHPKLQETLARATAEYQARNEIVIQKIVDRHSEDLRYEREKGERIFKELSEKLTLQIEKSQVQNALALKECVEKITAAIAVMGRHQS
jgi:hypothetical protein